MKRLILTLGIMLPAAVYANNTADQYVCKGDQASVKVEFGPEGHLPTMAVTNLGMGGSDSHEEALDRVEVEKSPMGLLVTGRFAAIADAKLTFTLIVPVVVIKDQDINGVEGMLVRSFEGTMPPPAHTSILGPLQHNEFRRVTCVASFVH